MELLVISSSALSFILAVILLGNAGRKADNKKKRLSSVNDTQETALYDEFNQSLYKRFIFPWIQSVLRNITKLLPKQKSKSVKYDLVEKQLRMAGLYLSATEFQLIKALIAGTISGIFFIISFFIKQNIMLKILIILFGSVLSLLVPNYYIKARVSGRQQKIREQLPEVLDLLSVCIEAGLSFDSALLKISEKMKGPFVDELLILHREIQMGRPRKDALHNMGECSNIPELKTFTSSMAQADQLGIPINNVLRVQAAQLRMTRKQQAQEKGMKAPVKMMIPMVVFIFPVIFIILLGPTILQLMKQFG